MQIIGNSIMINVLASKDLMLAEGSFMKTIKKEQMVFIIIIMIQLISMVYWGTQKNGYYVDEFFTFDKAHYLSQSTPKRVKLYDADFLTYDEWHDISELKSTLTVTRDESLLADPAGYNLKMLITKSPYMALLNYVQAVFFEGRLSKWSAISINILFFLLNQIILYRLTLRISEDRSAAIMTVMLYGFSGMAASMTVYVRFYMLITFWMTLYTYLHVLMWQEDSIRKNLVMEFGAVAILYLAYKNSPLAVIQGVGVIGAFLVGLMMRKRYRQAVVYGLPVVGGGVMYVLLKTDYIGYVLHPEKFADADITNIATESLLDNFLALTPGSAVDRSIELARLICQYLFGHILGLGGYLLLASGLLILSLYTKRDKTKDADWKFFFLAVCPCAFYCVVSICLDLEVIRYNSSIFPELAVCVWGSLSWDRQLLLRICRVLNIYIRMKSRLLSRFSPIRELILWLLIITLMIRSCMNVSHLPGKIQGLCLSQMKILIMVHGTMIYCSGSERVKDRRSYKSWQNRGIIQ